MVNFWEVVPFWFYGLVGIAFVILAFALSKLIPPLRLWMREGFDAVREGVLDKGREEERERERWFFYLAEIVRVFIFIIVFWVGYQIITYLLLSPPNVSIYENVLGSLTLPTVSLIITYYALKSLAYFIPKEWLSGE